MHILLVEDDSHLAELVMEYLTAKGYEVDYAANGKIALDLILSNHYQAIILDLNLPIINGIEVCQRMRQQGVSSPCIMLTARDSLENKLQGFESGANDYLVKPFSLAELVARLEVISVPNKFCSTFTIGGLLIDVKQHQVSAGSKTIKLTPDEFKLIHYLSRHSPHPVKKHLIEQHIWPQQLVTPEAYKMLIYRLRKAITPYISKPIIHTVRGVGIAMYEPEK
ncbi:response regulator transcription factor [Aliikangiella sp. IMCC44653]